MLSVGLSCVDSWLSQAVIHPALEQGPGLCFPVPRGTKAELWQPTSMAPAFSSGPGLGAPNAATSLSRQTA